MTVIRTRDELERLIEQETALIVELNAKKVEPEYYLRKDGSPYFQYPTGEYARHLTAIKDAHWRRRNWQGYLRDAAYSPSNNPG